ncbi:hypothetical protein PSHI8_15110 [Polynucleobacter sp. SHI8]|uniref:autotransporter family protein n=1 Tax=unclassified Polynucleobacter TaxID=2640945 RepID=UPI0024906311|nr:MULTISPECIES: autotransporter outer membrane beta-barrel domain-containing protein [unclassified Polynucleobacter]BDW11428.1 hypothetical protein PSHI2_15100 [Polynucleobacter sp. SHI2]BDW13875.1 hypothetical protein PSHI8_15110 [Polynucleobacter sp. SHI8]
MTNQLVLKKLGLGVGLFVLLNHSSQALATCSSIGDPLVFSADCTSLIVTSDKTSVSVNNGVIINDQYGSSYGPVTLFGNVFIGTFTNNGTISNTMPYQNVSGIYIPNGSGINNLINNGKIYTYGFSSKPANAIFVSGSVGSLTNTGTIQGDNGASGVVVGNGGYMGSIENKAGAVITAGAGVNAIRIDGDSVFNIPTRLGSITNQGTIQGIQVANNGSLGALNNLQSGLTYSGTLPSNYNIIISSATNYGQTTFSSVNGGPVAFGVSPLSSVPSGTNIYTNVVSGLTSGNFSATSGTFGGGIVTSLWSLSNSGGTNWNLSTTLGTPVAPTVPSSSSGTALASSITFAYSAALSSGKNPSLSNGSTFTSAVQGLTSTQVNQLTNVHAEGYSSNMTISLEHMAVITNTVLDRIHAPMSASPTAGVYQDDEGRYTWADASGMKGTVNAHNDLVGFGYRLYNLTIGRDLKRTKDGGYGVFGGVGNSSMTESDQVTQNFNKTSFYLGLYGTQNYADEIKVSAAAGYIYGMTDASRNTPSVGLFTGGNATSSYKTNGIFSAVKLAKAFQMQDFTVSPFVGASYSQLWMGGTTEQGGNDFNYSISSATSYSAVTSAGVDLIYPLIKGTNNPLSFVGFYKFGYDWFANSTNAHTITATSPIYGSFNQIGANMGPVSNVFGIGLQGQITQDVSARVGIVSSINSYGQEYGGGAEIRLKF